MALPSGIGVDSISVDVNESGTAAKVEITWPKLMCNTEKLLARFVNNAALPSYISSHTEILALEKSLKEIRVGHNLVGSDPIRSKRCNPLLSPVDRKMVENSVISCAKTQSMILLLRL